MTNLLLAILQYYLVNRMNPKLQRNPNTLSFYNYQKVHRERLHRKKKKGITRKNMKLYYSFLNLCMEKRCFPIQDLINLLTCICVCAETSYLDFQTFEYLRFALQGHLNRAQAKIHFSKVQNKQSIVDGGLGLYQTSIWVVLSNSKQYVTVRKRNGQ